MEWAPVLDSRVMSIPESESWKRFASCRGMDPEVFFPGNGTVGAGVAICETCPARKACLDYAITNNIQHGTWGGKTERQRKSMQRKHLRTLAKIRQAQEESKNPPCPFCGSNKAVVEVFGDNLADKYYICLSCKDDACITG